MNYGAFKTLVAGYLHRTDLTATIPDLIELGRIRATEHLRVPELEAKLTVTLTSGAGSLDQDLISIRSVTANSLELQQVSVGQLEAVTGGGFFAVYGSTIAAPGEGSVDVYCWTRPDTLLGAADAATRDFLSYYPSLWLQATLVECYRYLDDTENEQKASERLAREVREANARGVTTRYAAGAGAVGDGWTQQSMAAL